MVYRALVRQFIRGFDAWLYDQILYELNLIGAARHALACVGA